MNQERWRAVWNDWPAQFGSTDYLRQVGKTTDGEPIADEQVQLLAAELARKLHLESSDVLLDLCCGNGLITARLAEHCKRVVGVDFSRTLLSVARQAHARDNVTYELGSVLDLVSNHLGAVAFTKVLMCDALQYFTPNELKHLLNGLKRMKSAPKLILLANVLYRPQRWNFWARRMRSQPQTWLPLGGQDLLGHWWDEKDFRDACLGADLEFQIQRQRPELYNADFRVDVILW